MNSRFLGKVEEDWAGFSAEVEFESTYFGNRPSTIFLGEEYDEDGEEIEEAPNGEELADFERTYTSFEDNIASVVEQISAHAFERYLKLYAHYYEDKNKSGEEPLNISNKEKHFEYLKDVNYIRILADGNIKMLFHYKLDEEHGLEVRLENNEVLAIGGIAET